jgi:hypothetical protein
MKPHRLHIRFDDAAVIGCKIIRKPVTRKRLPLRTHARNAVHKPKRVFARKLWRVCHKHRANPASLIEYQLSGETLPSLSDSSVSYTANRASELLPMCSLAPSNKLASPETNILSRGNNELEQIFVRMRRNCEVALDIIRGIDLHV